MKMLWALSLSLIVSSMSGIALAQTDTSSEDTYVEDFVVNNTIATLYHEVGHMLIGELGIPVLAKEEDAADNLATLLLISAETVEADNAIIDAIDSYFLTDAANADSPIEDAELYDVHSLDTQRAFQMVCLAVGSDPEIFADIAENAGLDADRQESCAFDFEQARDSWNAVLEPYLVNDGPKPTVNISYEATETYAEIADFLRESEVLEFVRSNILLNYNLPRTVMIKTAECDEENAFYDPEQGEITMCYELAELYYTQATTEAK